MTLGYFIIGTIHQGFKLFSLHHCRFSVLPVFFRHLMVLATMDLEQITPIFDI